MSSRKVFIFRRVTQHKNKRTIYHKFITSFLFCGVFFVLLHCNVSVLDGQIFNYSLITECFAEGMTVNADSLKPIESGVAIVLVGIIGLFATLIAWIASLIELSLSPEFMTVITNPGIYIGWKVVRDILNMAFIFFLLYSAFCTIFQISRYHIKSTWVMIVVMALLVNFSWPITRVLIDFSNVTISYIVSGSGKGVSKGIVGEMANRTQFAKIVIGSTGKVNGDGEFEVKVGSPELFTHLFLGIIASALFAITLGMIAIILLIRIIALAVYLVFASVGYTMAAFPMTRSMSSQWWTGFTKQLIIGPVVLIGLMIAVTVLSELNTQEAFMQKVAKENGVVGTLLTYAVSLMIIWASVLAAQKVGSEGAGFAVGLANKAKSKLQNFAKKSTIGTVKFVGRGADKLTFKKASGAVASMHGLYGGLKQRFANADQDYKDAYSAKKDIASAKMQALGMDKASKIKDDATSGRLKKGMANIIGYGGDRNALQKLENKQVAEMKKKYKDNNDDMSMLMKKLTGSSDKAEQRALVEYLSDHKEFGKGNDDDYKDLMSSLNKLPENLQKSLEGKMSREGKAHVVYDRLEREHGDELAFKRIYNGMNAETWAKNNMSLERATKNSSSKMAQNLHSKLDNAGWASDFQRHANSAEALKHAKGVNGKHFV